MQATQLYRTVQSSVVELCSSLPAEEVEVLVPTCPQWTPKDVLAHVVGICSDFQTGRREGAGGDAWTAVQVESRADLTMSEILSEWAKLHDFIDELFAGNEDLAWALVADLVTHEFDIRLAVGRSGNKEAEAVVVSSLRYADRFLDRVGQSELAPIAVVVDGVRLGPDEARQTWKGSAFEILRATTGRRSSGQIKEMEWSTAADPYLEIISSYGPISETDIVE